MCLESTNLNEENQEHRSQEFQPYYQSLYINTANYVLDLYICYTNNNSL